MIRNQAKLISAVFIIAMLGCTQTKQMPSNNNTKYRTAISPITPIYPTDPPEVKPMMIELQIPDEWKIIEPKPHPDWWTTYILPKDDIGSIGLTCGMYPMPVRNPDSIIRKCQVGNISVEFICYKENGMPAMAAEVLLKNGKKEIHVKIRIIEKGPGFIEKALLALSSLELKE